MTDSEGFNPHTSVITIKAPASEEALLISCFEMRRRTGSLPQALVVGLGWSGIIREDSEQVRVSPIAYKFLVGGSVVPLLIDPLSEENLAVAYPRHIGPEAPPQNVARIGA
jgi:hypothetical protein